MRHNVLFAGSFLILLFLAGCGAAQLGVTVENHSSAALRNVEINYVSASFGIPYLAPAASYHKEVEPLRSGKLQMKYVDEAGKEHVSMGPDIHSGKSMGFTCEIRNDGVRWSAK